MTVIPWKQIQESIEAPFRTGSGLRCSETPDAVFVTALFHFNSDTNRGILSRWQEEKWPDAFFYICVCLPTSPSFSDPNFFLFLMRQSVRLVSQLVPKQSIDNCVDKQYGQSQQDLYVMV